MNRITLADAIFKRLENDQVELKEQFCSSVNKINTFYIDNLLDEDIAYEIFRSFPEKKEMMQKRSLREDKNVAAQMNKYNPILEEIVYAFQDNRIVDLIGKITGLKEMYPDEYLYAGGLSMMTEGNFLNPHLDNSHDNERSNYRVLNLLYYVTPNWKEEYGGNLELWDDGVRGKPRTVHAKFNRLVVMITNKTSYHSVSKVIVNNKRCCVSNYYFSPVPAEPEEYFHVTSFLGRPEEKVKNALLIADAKLRNTVRMFFKKGIIKNPHIYDKGEEK